MYKLLYGYTATIRYKLPVGAIYTAGYDSGSAVACNEKCEVFMGLSAKDKLMSHLSDVEAMIDFYQFAIADGAASFRSASGVLDALMRGCRKSLYEVMESLETEAANQPERSRVPAEAV